MNTLSVISAVVVMALGLLVYLGLWLANMPVPPLWRVLLILFVLAVFLLEVPVMFNSITHHTPPRLYDHR